MAASPFTRRFPARNSEFPALRAFVESVMATAAPAARHPVMLLVEELFCNSVNHGYGAESDEPVWITLSFDDRYCHVIYEDCGPAHDPFGMNHDPMLDASVDARPVGGLGVLLLTELSASHSYERRGDRNVIELKVACT